MVVVGHLVIDSAGPCLLLHLITHGLHWQARMSHMLSRGLVSSSGSQVTKLDFRGAGCWCMSYSHCVYLPLAEVGTTTYLGRVASISLRPL
jgi:hypothetical protein